MPQAGESSKLEFPTKSGQGIKRYSACSYSAGRRTPATNADVQVVEDLAVLEERCPSLRSRGEVRVVPARVGRYVTSPSQTSLGASGSNCRSRTSPPTVAVSQTDSGVRLAPRLSVVTSWTGSLTPRRPTKFGWGTSRTSDARGHDADFAPRAEARAALFEYSEVFYNLKRRHSSLGYVAPAEYEQAE